MHKRIEIILKVLTVPILIYPVGPMGIPAFLFSMAGLFRGIKTDFVETEIINVFSFLFLFGGALGAIGLLLCLFSVKSKLVIFMLVAGFLSYSKLIYNGSFRGPWFEQLYMCLPLVLAIGYIYLSIVKLREKNC